MDLSERIQLLVVLLAVLAFAWNLYVLILVGRSQPLRNLLAQEGPFARGALKAVWWTVIAEMVYLANMSFAAIMRNVYALPFFIDNAPPSVVWLVVEQYVLTYAIAVLPATILFYLVLALAERDRLINAQLKAKRDIRSRNARTNPK